MVELLGKNNSLTKLRKYCRLFGFFPYDLVQIGDRVNVKFSWKYLVWSYFLGSSLIISGAIGTILSLLHTSSWFPPAYVNAMVVVYIVHMNFMLNILSGVVCVTYTTLSRRNLEKFINNIIKADILLDELKIPKKKNRCSKPIAIFVMIFIIIIFIADSTSHYLVLDKNSFFMHVLRKIPYFTSYFFFVSQTYTVWNLILLIRARICAMKEELTVFNSFLESDRSIIVQEFRSSLIQLSNKGRQNFKHHQEIYICVFDAAKAIDELVRPFVVLSFTTRFFSLLITPFITYVQILGYNDKFFIVSQTLWALGQISLLALIIEPASSCRREYKELRQELSKLLCYEKVANVDLNILFDLVRSLPIDFHLNDATPLRRILYVSVLGGITTFLVVLFQMKLP